MLFVFFYVLVFYQGMLFPFVWSVIYPVRV